MQKKTQNWREVKSARWIGLPRAPMSALPVRSIKTGEVLFTDTFNTHYLPWRDVFQYGRAPNCPATKVYP
jgi:hypothetical protein